MEATTSNVISAVFAYLQFWLAPLLTLVVSGVYFRASSPNHSLGKKLAVSAHGVVITVLYVGAMVIWWSGGSNPIYERPFLLLLSIPAVLIVYSLFAFRGRLSVHLLQVINIAALAWTYFIGIMAVTGNWL